MMLKSTTIRCLLFFTLIFSHSHAIHEATVALDTANPLLPLYLSVASTSQHPYISDILRYNLSNNGYTRIIDVTEQKEARLQKEELSEQFHKLYWKQEGVKYVIKTSIRNGALILSVFDTDKSALKEFSTQPLTFSLDHDARSLHALTDKVVHWLFGKPGVASTKILYAEQHSYEENGLKKYESDIWEISCDGREKRKITSNAGYCVTPYAISGSDTFLFVSYKCGEPKIFIGNKRSNAHEMLIPLRGNQLLPSISANKRKIAFICDASGRADLFIQVFDEKKGCLGKPLQAYSFPSSVQASPTLSPDGTKVAFVSDKTGTPRVYVIDTPRYSLKNKLPNALLLSKACRENTSPSWSPDGKKIAYSARIGDTRQIVIFDLTGGEEWQVTSGPLHKENPSWAPNSLHIVYNTVNDENGDLFIVDINEKRPVKITSGPGKKHFPSWEN